MFDFEYMLAIHSHLHASCTKQTDFWSGCWEHWGVHCHSEGVPLSSTFSGGYLSTSLYQTTDWGLIGIEQDLSQVCAKLLAGLLNQRRWWHHLTEHPQSPHQQRSDASHEWLPHIHFLDRHKPEGDQWHPGCPASIG